MDPKETQDQDHYKVLGLSALRYKASDNHIKKAYRFKVLNHHPDKRKAKGEEIKVGPLTRFFFCLLFVKIFDLPRGQIYDPSLGRILFFFVLPGNSQILLSDI